MADNKPLEVQEKKELVAKGEKTVPARYYMPNTDIRETEDALLVVMEVPGVDRKDVDIKVEEDTLSIEARIDTRNTRAWSRSTPSTMSATSRGDSPCRT